MTTVSKKRLTIAGWVTLRTGTHADSPCISGQEESGRGRCFYRVRLFHACKEGLRDNVSLALSKSAAKIKFPESRRL